MRYLTKLKLSPITHLADARFAAASGIDYMGFCFDTASPDFITPIKAKEIIEWTSGSQTVAEFGKQTLQEIIEISELLNMDMVALNNQILPDELMLIGKPIMKIIDCSELNLSAIEIEFDAYSPFAEAFVLTGNLDIQANKEWLHKICSTHKIIWSVPAEPKQIKEIIETFKPFAINLKAGTEEKTGLKDFDALYNVLEALEVVG
ncbi:MAG: hypothetical protein Q8M15_15770 [Bacteroidota bacterium]|nr:hypothetical protein [Bacteroidota bacterium]